MLDLRYLNKSWICGYVQKTVSYIGLTFEKAVWLEAQVRYHQPTFGHRTWGWDWKKLSEKQKRSGVWCHETKRIFQDKAKGQQYQIGQIKWGPKWLCPNYKHLCAFAQTILQLETIETFPIFLSRIVSNCLTFAWWFTEHHHMLPHLLTKISRVKTTSYVSWHPSKLIKMWMQ